AARAVRRHAAAGLAGPHARPALRRAADGRAVRRAGRDDPRRPARRAGAHLDGAGPQRPVRHPQRAGGGSARRPGGAARQPAGPVTVGRGLAGEGRTGWFWGGVATTARRALVGFAVATLIGLLVGFAVARFAVLRAAVGSMVTGLQTMPSIAWFPLAIVLFGL